MGKENGLCAQQIFWLVKAGKAQVGWISITTARFPSVPVTANQHTQWNAAIINSPVSSLRICHKKNLTFLGEQEWSSSCASGARHNSQHLAPWGEGCIWGRSWTNLMRSSWLYGRNVWVENQFVKFWATITSRKRVQLLTIWHSF